MRAALETAKTSGLARAGDVVVILAGSPDAGPGHTDSIRVATVG
jgi:pyruvate kinase